MASNNEDDHSKTKRAPNFTLEEDTQLAKSWVVTSEDAIHSNQQGKDEFFACIADDYNRFTPGPPRDGNKLQSRWKNIQKFILRFAAIYNQMASNPASGTSPLDWLINAKEMYLQTKNRAFTHDSAWNIVKDAPKWKKLMTGHAKNGARPSPRPSSHSAANSTSAESPSLSASFQSQPNPSSTPQGANESELRWKRPKGIKQAKRKVEESGFRRQKLKLLEKATRDADRQIAAANRLNEIQERLAATEEQNSDLKLMLQDLTECGDEELHDCS
ncbi:hypothetical protein PTTG_28898 [Puccinia triticina 1-1 BBBD Race 1]|uniref:NAM-associated domain-containing protein n=1 Tax=Puccinia triticina (isolate 1-1 / race 1 (BBBD)) TaxID=630390 RepID=A0A180G950_PUCT1|nr:hypothetical protein PTTG_28898 [Puccinia triticina 1-1 BBBD Race 1]